MSHISWLRLQSAALISNRQMEILWMFTRCIECGVERRIELHPFPYAPKWLVGLMHVFAFAFVIFGILTFLSIGTHTPGSIVMPSLAWISVALLACTTISTIASGIISACRESQQRQQSQGTRQAPVVQRQPVASAVILLRLRQLKQIRATMLRDIAGEFRGGRVIKLDD